MWAWSQISNLWTLRWFDLFYLDVSNQIFAELRCTMDHNGTVCGISFGWYGYQHATSRFFLMFCFQITCTGGCFLMNFHEVWMFVLLRIAISGLCYSQIFLFGSLATHVHVVMTCWNVTCSSTLNDVKRTPRNLKNVGNSDWSLPRQWQIELRDHAKFEEPDWMKNQTQRNNIIIFLHVWVWGSGLVILLLVNVRAFACSIEWFSVSVTFFSAFQSQPLPCRPSKLAVLIVWSCPRSAQWSIKSCFHASF